MEQKENNSQEQLDTVWVLKYIFSNRIFIAKVVGVTILLCFVIGLVKPNKYTATASIIPVGSNTGVDLGGLNSLASLAGVSTGKSKSGVDIVTPDLYPKVAQSTPFLLGIMDVKVPWTKPDTIMSFYEYACWDSLPSFGEYVKMYTVNLPSTLASMFKSEPKSKELQSKQADIVEKKEPSYIVFSRPQLKAISMLRGMITVEEDPIYNTIEIKVIANNPHQASILASSVVERLQSEVIEHKTRRAKYMLDFIQDRYNESSLEYETVRKKFFDYKDSHRNMISERVDVEYQRLSDQYDLSYSILKSISSQLEQAKLAFMENTPVFSVVQPVVYPYSKSGPKMSLYVISGIMLGLFVSMGWLLGQVAWWQIFDEEKVRQLAESYK